MPPQHEPRGMTWYSITCSAPGSSRCPISHEGGASATLGAEASMAKNTAPFSRTARNTPDRVSALTCRVSTGGRGGEKTGRREGISRFPSSRLPAFLFSSLRSYDRARASGGGAGDRNAQPAPNGALRWKHSNASEPFAGDHSSLAGATRGVKREARLEQRGPFRPNPARPLTQRAATSGSLGDAAHPP